VVRIGFEEAPVGSLPPGWAVSATNPAPQDAQWEVTREQDGNALTITSTRHAEKRTFNLLTTDLHPFKDGEVSVRLRANTGVIDQGGGLVWRFKDPANYYIARYNPLEENLRLYYVLESKRVMLGDAPNIKIPAGEWTILSVTHAGNHITVSLNGTKYLEADDVTFAEAGGVGFWSKADAATSFDDLTIKRTEP
jgi:hypothetical protein